MEPAFEFVLSMDGAGQSFGIVCGLWQCLMLSGDISSKLQSVSSSSEEISAGVEETTATVEQTASSMQELKIQYSEEQKEAFHLLQGSRIKQ